MKKIFLQFFSVLVLFSLFFQEIHAQIAVESPTDLLPASSIGTTEWVGTFISGIITYGIALAGILAVIATTWSGIMMLMAAGDEEKFKKARKIMIIALVGVGVAGGAYAIVTLITNLKF